MEAQPVERQPEGRPYRSHKLPACTTCRHRKGRCHVDDATQPCRYCRQRSLACDHGGNIKRRKVVVDKRATYPQGITPESVMAFSTVIASLPQTCFEDMQTPSESSPVMVDPTMADDLDVLESHLAPGTLGAGSGAQRYIRMSSIPGDSVVYRKVPRLREGLQSIASPGVAQREIMENVIGTHVTDVIKLYFDVINPSFPVLDEASFWKLWQKDRRRISSTLLCDIYAVALPYWSSSEILRGNPRPDVQFVWNQAVLALRDDFMAPSLTTVHAALLDLLGHPIYHVTGNIVNAGRTVSLAYSQGLHRDPATWRTSSSEKSLRVRVWWAVLIHDHWSSLSHGTPPNIVSNNYDVPLPLPESFMLPKASEAYRRASMSFYHLCWLTKILGEMLPLVYSLEPKYQETWKVIRRTECALDEWEDALPDYLGANMQDSIGPKPCSSGLWFYFLTLKLMLNRLALRIALRDKAHAQLEVRQYRFIELYKSASILVEFVASLRSSQFREFWLPYTAYLLVSATTTLLRCTVETSKPEDKDRSARALLRLLTTLRTARQDYDWDLAALCIDTCGESIERVAAASQIPSSEPATAVAPHAESQQAGTDMLFAVENIDFPFDLEVPWDHLWDDMAEPWRLERYVSLCSP